MASLVRVWVVTYHTPDGRRCKKGTPKAVKKRTRSAKWYAQGVAGWPRGKRVPLATDRQAAKRMLDDLVRSAERGHAGIRTDAARPLAPLLDEFAAALAAKADAKSANEVVLHATHVLDACRCRTVADLTAPGVPAAAEAAVWALTRPPESLAPSTAAKYGKHARQFCRWLWLKRGLLDRDPLAGIDLPSQAAARPRRHLDPDELARLFAAAAASPTVFRGMAGADRLTIYLTAAGTGFRAGELARLTPDRFDLDADPPTVRPVPRGPRSKTRDGKPQPLPPVVADRLREYLKGRPPGVAVWPGTGWAADAWDMIGRDLAAAGVPADTPEGHADFHSLRHSYASLVADVAPVKVAQELVRHADPKITIGRYSHTSAAAKAEAVGRIRLPAPGDPAPAPAPELTRDQLETLVGVLAGLLAVFAPRLAPPAGATGEGPGRPGTERPGGGRRRTGTKSRKNE